MPHNLPVYPTPFIGRADEITELSHLLENPDCRLLTLVGPGGIGKTRLALALAQGKLNAFPSGVWHVPLQPLPNAEAVLPTIVDVLPLQVTDNLQEELLGFLHDKHLLLVLDNFEHVLGGAPLVSDMLAAAPKVKVLVSSREVLKLMEEWSWPVDGLTYPTNGNMNDPAAYSAVDLFAYHAGRVSRDFSLDDEREHVVRICQHVGGLPLALELAAGQLDALSCQNLASRIEHDLGSLATDVHNMPDRHRSMQAVLDTSWGQMGDAEQAVIRSLSVFRGGFALEAAEAVANASLKTLQRLVRASWIRMSDGRYDMQEVLREYAAEQLIAASENETIAQSHCHYYADFLQQREPDIKGGRQMEAYWEITVDFENIRAAWHRAVDHRDYAAINQGVETLYRYVVNNRPTPIHHELFVQVAAQLAPQAHETPTPTWGRIVVRSIFYDSDLAWLPKIDAALDLAQQHEDVAEIGHSLWAKAYLAIEHGQFAKSLDLFEQCLAHYRQLDDPFYTADALIWIGMCHRALANIERSLDYLQRSLDMRHACGDILGQYNSRWVWADLLFFSGEYDRADHGVNQAFSLLQQARANMFLAVASPSQARWLTVESEGHSIRYHRQRGLNALLLGDDDAVQAHHQALMAMNVDFEFVIAGCGSPLIFLGLLAALGGDHQTGHDFLVNVHEIRKGYLWTDIPLAAWGLSLVYLDLNDHTQAQNYLVTLLQDGISMHSVLLMTLALPVAAVIVAREGQPKYAVELLGLAFTHPKSATGWMEKWPLLTRLREDLEAELGPDAYAAAWERGANSDLETTAESLHRQFSDQPHPNGKLANPLTNRELEVLHLVAEGLSNRQIGQNLTIAVGTVKGYVYDICQKLYADNRTHAAVIARERGLLDGR